MRAASRAVVAMRWRLAAACAVLAVCCASGGTAVGQRAPAGAARTATILWDQVPLGDAVERLAGTYGAAVFVDRRVDPSRRIALDLRGADVQTALVQTAAAAELGLSRLGDVAYVGPQSAADQMRTLAALRADEMAALAAGSRAALERKRPLEWPRLAEPRALVERIVAERGWTAVGSERIPHDLWPAGRLPALTMAEQLTVLLAGFDLTFRLVEPSRTVEIVPIEGPVAVSRRYRLRYGASDLAHLEPQFPAARMELDGEWLIMQARIEDHERLADLLKDATRATEPMQPSQAAPGRRSAGPAGPAKKVYTLRVEDQPVRAILAALAQKLSWQIEIDEAAIQAAGRSLDRRVSFEVKDVEADELLNAVLRPAGLHFRRVGEKVQIVP